MSTIAEVLEWSWAVTRAGTRLHHVARIDREWGSEWPSVKGETTCGLEGGLFVPGIVMRMSGMRCKHCCRMLGIAWGTGSPKNDDELRQWVSERLDE